MTASTEERWAIAVRILAVIAGLAVMVAVLEGRTVRQARAELQAMRTERDTAKAGVASLWAAQSADDVDQALRWLNDFAGDPTGLGRPGGVCSGGHLDDRVIAADVFGVFLPARASGKSVDASMAVMWDALRRSDAYRQAHPGAAPHGGVGAR